MRTTSPIHQDGAETIDVRVGPRSRLAGLAGVLFVACLLIAPDPSVREGLSAEQIMRFYAENQGGLGWMLILIGLGYVFFLFFVSALQPPEGEVGIETATRILLIASGLIAGFYVIGAALRALPTSMVAGGITQDLFEPLARMMDASNNALIEISTFWRGTMLGAAAWIVLKTRLAPKWLGWFAALLAVTSFAGALSFAETPLQGPAGAVGFASYALFHLWVLLTGIALMLRGRSRTRTSRSST